MIPKKIHYCWFGRNPKPEIIEKCIASWRKYCPDYEIIEWNEDNYDISKSDFMREAYDSKKWGFVPDYARFDIILENGGFYLDTDVELYSSLDEYLEYGAWFAFESGRNIATGLGFGAEKGHASVRACLEPYSDKHFIIDGKMDMTPSPGINTDSLKQAYPSLIRNGQTQIIDNVCFLGCNDYSKKLQHYGTATWVEGYKTEHHVYRPSKIKGRLRNYKAFDYVEKHFGKKALKIYTFCVYDLLEYGPVHFIKRIGKK